MKRKIGCLLAVTMLFSNISGVYAADTPDVGAAESIESSVDEMTEDSAAEVLYDSDPQADAEGPSTAAVPIDQLEEDTKNFIHIDYDTAEGSYKLTVKCDYTYTDTSTFKNNGVYAQIWTISALDGQNEVTGNVEIPETVEFEGKDYTVVSIKQSAFENCTMESVTLPSTIHEIQARAFLNCPNLKWAYISSSFDPERVNEDGVKIDVNTSNAQIASVVGDNAFAGCTALETVTINGFAKLGNYIFEGCTSLTDPYIGMDEAYVIASGAIKVDKNNIPVNQTFNVGTYLFSGCTALESYTFPENINTVGAFTFNGCTALEHVDTGVSLKSLATTAFTDCSNLKDINVGKTFSTALVYDFIASSPLFEGFTVDRENTKFLADEGILFNKVTGKVTDENGDTEVKTYSTVLYTYPPAKKDEEYVLPGTITTVTSKAFYAHKYLKSFMLNTAPTYTKSKTGEITSVVNKATLGEYVFYGAEKLHRVEFVTDTVIGSSDFEGSSVVEAEFDAVVAIGKNAFKDCISLAVLKHNVEPESFSNSTIGESAFSGCTSLKGKLTVNDFNYIGAKAFQNCTGITSLVLERTGSLKAYAFAGCTALENADISKMFDNTPLANDKYKSRYNITAGVMESYVFSGCTNLKECVFNTQLFKISEGTFENCTALEKVTNVNPEDMYVIGSKAFANCTSLVEAPYSRFLTRLDANAFINCSNLEKITLTKSAVIFNSTKNTGVFNGCEKLTIYAPEGTPAIDHAIANNIPYVFTDNDIRDEEFLILDEALDANGNITGIIAAYRGGFASLEIPADLTYNGYPVTMINDKFIGDQSMSDCSVKSFIKDIKLTGIKDIGVSAFSGCTKLEDVEFDDKCETIGNNAFYGCTSLYGAKESVDSETGEPILDSDGNPVMYSKPFVAPKNLKSIGTSAFQGCTGIEEIIFEEGGSVEVGTNAFKKCSNLKRILALGTKDIQQSAFESCTSLEEVKFSPTVENVYKYAFRGCTSLESVTIQSGMFLDDEAFANCTALERIVISPTSNAAFSTSAFKGSSENAYIVCQEGSAGYAYAQKSGVPVELAEFLDPSETSGYAVIKGALIFPEDIVTVTRNKQTLASGDHIYGDEQLVIALKDDLDPSIQYNVSLNGDLIDELPIIYTVKENENVELTVVTGAKIPLTTPEPVIVTRNNKQIKDGGYVIAGDVIKISATTDPYIAVSYIKCNGVSISSGKTYTVKDTDQAVEITATIKYYGKLTFPDDVTVKASSATVTSPYILKGSKREQFNITVPEAAEGTINAIFINGKYYAQGPTVTYMFDKPAGNVVGNLDITYKTIDESYIGSDNVLAFAKKVLRYCEGIADLTDAEKAAAELTGDGEVNIFDVMILSDIVR